MPTPACLDRAFSLMQIEDTMGKEGERKRRPRRRSERRRRRWVGLGKVLVTPCLEASTKILKILILRSYQLLKLIMPLLDKITKSGQNHEERYAQKQQMLEGRLTPPE